MKTIEVPDMADLVWANSYAQAFNHYYQQQGWDKLERAEIPFESFEYAEAYARRLADVAAMPFEVDDEDEEKEE